MAGRTSFEFGLGPAPKRPRPDDESALRILVLGDFSARAQRGIEESRDLARRKPTAIDVDDFDRVMARIAPRLLLGGDKTLALEFSALDDFHPDRLHRLALFQGFHEARRRMQDPASFAEAAAQDAEAFARLVGGAPPPATAQRRHDGSVEAQVQALIREAVAPHIVPDAPPQQALYVAAVDAAVGEQMRAILQAPQFKALEALWRGLYWLASNLETDEQLKLCILDVSRAELNADCRKAEGRVESSGLYRLLVEEVEDTTEEERWSLIVGQYSFGPAGEDVELLAHLGAVASHAGAPFLAAAESGLVGCSSIAATPDPRDWTPPAADAAERWSALRKSAVAPWIGLTLPRMLLRLPYGKSSDPVESFPFEELAPRRQHESYLWGNGALACALLMGRAFASRGWEMEPGDELEVEDLPAHVYDDGGGKRLQPCAEAALADRAAEAILSAGLMPLLSRQGRNAVRLMRFQSIASPARALSGPWS
jgi:type VI secretion system protein ImpC